MGDEGLVGGGVWVGFVEGGVGEYDGGGDRSFLQLSTASSSSSPSTLLSNCTPLRIILSMTFLISTEIEEEQSDDVRIRDKSDDT